MHLNVPALVTAAFIGLVPVTAVTPTAAVAQEKPEKKKLDPAAHYDYCMDKAEAALAHCLDHAEETEVLCWAAYGYHKLGCTLAYAARLIIGE
jgi:hypothetical protein